MSAVSRRGHAAAGLQFPVAALSGPRPVVVAEQARRAAPPEPLAVWARGLPLEELDAGVHVLLAARRAAEPQDAAVPHAAAQDAAVVVVVAGVPGAAAVAAVVPGVVAAAVVPRGAVVVPRVAVVPGALPSAAAWACRRDQVLPWPEPPPTVRIERATERLQIAWP